MREAAFIEGSGRDLLSVEQAQIQHAEARLELDEEYAACPTPARYEPLRRGSLVLSRREKKIQREKGASENALTFRQRLGVSLSRLSQSELDQVVSGLAHRGNANALARLADQAFGKPEPAEEDKPEDNWLAALTREQRAVVRSWIESMEDESIEAADAPNHNEK